MAHEIPAESNGGNPFDAAEMSRTQIIAVALTVLLSAMDGFDVLSVTFAAPAISLDWGIGKAELGVILSSGLAGMALGSFFLAPLADVFGRKPLTLVCLVMMSVGMLLSSFAATTVQLAATRLLTGVGIGACVAIINPLAAEFANLRRRPLAVALMALGYPAGGLVGGLLAAALLKAYGWHAVFFAGFIATTAMIPIIALFLPESLAHLLTGRRHDSLGKANVLLQRCGHAPLKELPPRQPQTRKGYAAVFAVGQRIPTARLAMINLFYGMAAFYVLSWLPQLIADAGYSPSTASFISALSSVAGIVGGVLLGLAAPRWGLVRLTAAMMFGLGVGMTGLGFAPASIGLLTLAATVCGYCLYSGVAGFYATLASEFPPEARASGVGFVIGVGRVSSAIGPLAAGFLFAQGFGKGTVSAMFGALAILAALILVLVPPRHSAKHV